MSDSDDIVTDVQLLMAGWADHGTRPDIPCDEPDGCAEPSRWSWTDPLTRFCTNHATSRDADSNYPVDDVGWSGWGAEDEYEQNQDRQDAWGDEAAR